jgi:hypothetical protein
MNNDLIGIEKELQRLCSNLDQLTEEFQGLCRIAADARCDYDVAWARALLKQTQKGDTVKVRESEATLICEHQMREARIAESLRDAAKERIRALQSIISVHQSRLRYMDETKRTF